MWPIQDSTSAFPWVVAASSFIANDDRKSYLRAEDWISTTILASFTFKLFLGIAGVDAVAVETDGPHRYAVVESGGQGNVGCSTVEVLATVSSSISST